MNPSDLEPIDGVAVRVIPGHDSCLRWLLSPMVSRRRFWMTYRLPGQRWVRITRPDGASPSDAGVLAHELIHARQFATAWGPWLLPLLAVLLPLPVLFSGRWFIERHAYLHDIRTGRHSIESAVRILWRHYGWCWPRPLMRRWFAKRIDEQP